MTADVDTTRWLLPSEAYWSPSWYETEQERVFARNWNMVGTTDDLAGGRALVASVAGHTVVVSGTAPALVARQRSGPACVDTWAGYVFVHLDPRSRSPAVRMAGRLPRPHWWLPARPARRGRPSPLRAGRQLEAVRREPHRRLPPVVPAPGRASGSTTIPGHRGRCAGRTGSSTSRREPMSTPTTNGSGGAWRRSITSVRTDGAQVPI